MGFKTWAAGDVLTAANVNDYLMEQAVISCTSSTRPSSPNEGMTIYETDTDKTYQYTGSAWGQVLSQAAWDTYTPTLSQGASSDISKTVNRASYTRVGRVVWLVVHLVATGTGTAGSEVTVTLPITAAYSSTALTVGAGFYLDSDTANYPCVARMPSTTTLVLNRTDSATVSGVGVSPNIAVASNDQFVATVTYEAAAAS